jgi:hypothetical protein
MKKTTILLLLVISSISSICQQTGTSTTLAKDDYLQKSKNKKTAAWMFLAGGAAMTITGFAISGGEPELNILCLCYVDENSGTKGLLIAGGVLSMGASVFFFKSSAKYKRKAMELAFKNESAPRIMAHGFAYRTIPSLNLKIKL